VSKICICRIVQVPLVVSKTLVLSLTDECVDIQGEHRKHVEPALEHIREDDVEEYRCE
jgi:hypothetical protein